MEQIFGEGHLYAHETPCNCKSSVDGKTEIPTKATNQQYCTNMTNTKVDKYQDLLFNKNFL